MSFRTLIGTSGLCKFHYMRISGLPFIWSTVPLPSEWESAPGEIMIGEETYTHHATLAPGGDWASIEDRAEPWTGLSTASRLDFEFLLPGTPDMLWEATDPWMQILAGSIKRGACSVLVADLPATAGVASLDRVSHWPVAGLAHIGLEAVTWLGTDIVDNELLSLTRGRYGSWFTYHAGDMDGVIEYGAGPYVADHPLALAGRVVELWVGTGYTHSLTGDLVPWGSTICSSADRMIYRGIVRAAKPDKAQGKVRLSTEGLRSILATEVGLRLPKGVVGTGRFNRPIYIDESNRYLGWAFWWGDAATDPNKNNIAFSGVPLQYDLGGTSTEVADGWYSMAFILEAISWTMTSGLYAAAIGPASIASRYPWIGGAVGIFPKADEGGQLTYEVSFTANDTSSATTPYTFELLDAEAPGSLWREFGFTSRSRVEPTVHTNTTDWRVTADRRAATFYLPPASQTYPGRQIIIRHKSGPDFIHSPGWQAGGWLDEDGNAIPGHLRIGEEVVSISSSGTFNDGAIQYQVVTLSRRELFNSISEEIYVEYDAEGDPDDVEVVQGLVFPRTSWGRACAYLAHMMQGDGVVSPYDVGWRGAGAALPAHLIDVDSWIDVSRKAGGVRDIAVFGPQKLDEILARSLVSSHCIICPRWSESTGTYQLVARDMRPPLAHEAAASYDLTTSNLLTIGGDGIGWEVDETGIIGSVIATNIGYDHGAEKALRKLTWRDGTAQATWPDARPLDLDMRDIADPDEAARRVLDMAQALSAQYGRPFLVMRLPIAMPDPAWILEIGDAVRVTHPLVIQRAAVARGVTRLDGRVVGVAKRFRTQSRTAGIATVIASEDGAVFAGWAPSAVCHTRSGSNQVLHCYDHYDSHDEADSLDVELFPVGCKVRISPFGDDSLAVLRTVTDVTVGAADDSTITVDSAVALSPPLYIEPADYDDAGTIEQHRRYAYLSDGDGVLERPDGTTDPAYEYL